METWKAMIISDFSSSENGEFEIITYHFTFYQ